MTAAPRRITTFLPRAGLLSAALAIITGLFGMHIMAGAHSMAGHGMPAPGAGHTAHASVELHAGSAGHDDTGTDLSPHRFSAAETISGSSCSVGGSCPEMAAAGGACVLSAKTTSLNAPLPGTAPYVLPDFGSAATAGSTYSYSPDSPSPGDLCISRT